MLSQSSQISAPSRRHFLQSAFAGGLAVALAGVPAIGHAAQPVRRTGKPHLKLSLAAYSFNSLLDLKNTKMTLDEFVHYCAELGLDGTELTSYYFPRDFGDDYLLHLKELTFRLGLDISGVGIRNEFCIPPGPNRDAELAHTRRWIDYAARLGAPVIRIFGGRIQRGDADDVAISRAAAGINECLDDAARNGVVLALENHYGEVTDTPDLTLRLIAQVKDSPWFGINFDTGGYRGADAYRELALIAPYAVNVHMTNFIRRGDAREEADLERLVRILVDAGYRGFIGFQYIALDSEARRDPKIVIRGYIERLRKIIRELGVG
jgi:sugar phosphate isomerase/epimerase